MGIEPLLIYLQGAVSHAKNSCLYKNLQSHKTLLFHPDFVSNRHIVVACTPSSPATEFVWLMGLIDSQHPGAFSTPELPLLLVALVKGHGALMITSDII
jgi:hypothetical protein